MNSRPLVYVGEDINSSVTLTPRHLLTLNPNIGIPEVDFGQNDPDYCSHDSFENKLLKNWKKGQKFLDNFWKIWKDDYLICLRERTQSSLRQARVKAPFSVRVGDIVMIKDDLPRGTWKMGKIVELRQSRDGQVRSAKVKQASGKILGRPLKLLYPLECSVTRDAKTEEEINQIVVPSSGVNQQLFRSNRKEAEFANKESNNSLLNFNTVD